jgi:lipoprotein-releasing system permease protein
MKKTGLLLFIARKYLFARKSYAIINIISLISVIGVAVGTMALFVVLSVFNGFEDLILKLFNNFHSDLKIESVEGKTIQLQNFPVEELKNAAEIYTVTYVIEDLALARYSDRQHLVTVKAVSEEFLLSPSIDSIILRGDALLEENGTDHAILGAVVDYVLGINPNDYTKFLSLYVPKRTVKSTVSMSQAFHSQSVMPSSVFSVQQEYDESYIIIPLETGKRLYEYDNEVTSLEIMLKPGSNLKKAWKNVTELIGNSYTVKDRYQQQEFIYKILRTEKLAIFFILSFILVIATFNVIGTLSMIILEKRKDIAVMNALGAPLSSIRRLFVIEGLLVIFTGAIAGLILGAALCWAQQTYGLLSLGHDDAGFVVQAYPVKMKITDILIVLATVGAIGVLSSLIPSGRITANFASLMQQERQ